jgi:hypothetical protein
LFCPKCRDEFQEWVKTCPDCRVDLVAELPPVSRPGVNPFKPVRPFDPPLYKPGIKRCPNCGQHQGWYRAFPLWAWLLYPYEWKCAKCQTTLRYDFGRYLVISWLVVAPLLVIVGLLAESSPDGAIWIWLACLVFALVLLAWWWSASIRRRGE